jgi:serine/threonine protein kinase
VRHRLPSDLRLIDPIGEGGAGTVWRAWDPRTRAFVAAKVLAPGSTPETHRPVHPHVLVADRVTAGHGAVVLVMELVRGGTADQLLAEHGALPESYVAVLLDQLLQALAAVHAAGLVHRDVKPANLLLEPTGRGRPQLLLGDFDAATAYRGPSAAEVVGFAGTDGYLAPELFGGAAPDPRQDLYAAGVTAAELLTGRIPRRPRDLPRGRLRRLLVGLTDPDPDRRPPTAAAALDLLRACGVPAGTPWAALPHPPVVPDRFADLRPPIGPVTWAALAVACVLVLGVVVRLS